MRRRMEGSGKVDLLESEWMHSASHSMHLKALGSFVRESSPLRSLSRIISNAYVYVTNLEFSDVYERRKYVYERIYVKDPFEIYRFKPFHGLNFLSYLYISAKKSFRGSNGESKSQHSYSLSFREFSKKRGLASTFMVSFP